VTRETEKRKKRERERADHDIAGADDIDEAVICCRNTHCTHPLSPVSTARVLGEGERERERRGGGERREREKENP
jgi:hypothetical protein